MADRIDPQRRSENMRRIKSTGTKPEMLVRRMVHGFGYRYRLHAKELPGKPDLVFRPKRKVIFVHGCFWHAHESPDCPDWRRPASNVTYWNPKLARNRERDAEHTEALKAAGWKVLTVWDCETADRKALERRIKMFLK